MLNKRTSEFKAVVTDLLDQNKENVCKWLNLVANGDGADLKPDPGKALDLMGRLAEYAYPKLARTEVTGPEGGPQELKISWLDK